MSIGVYAIGVSLVSVYITGVGMVSDDAKLLCVGIFGFTASLALLSIL